jgi:serine protease
MPPRLFLPAALATILLSLPAVAGAADYVPGEVIVKYRDRTSGSVETLQQVTGTEAERTLAGGSQQLAIEDGDSVRETLAELRADPNVAYAVPNHVARAAAFVPNDPDFRLQWNLQGPFGIKMPDAWSLAADLGAPGGRGALVAVLDSGVAYQTRGRFKRAPDLRRSTFTRGWDFVDRDRHPNDIYGHGTHVAGTIAQTTNNGRGTAGIAYGARIMPLRVLDWRGEGDSVAISRAIRYAARHRADVINLSLEFEPEVRSIDIPDVLSALRFARRRGVLVVAAAGNAADLAVAYPARATSVLAVGATTVTGCEAEYSNAGDDLDVVAPGGGIDAPNSDNLWDQTYCKPDSLGQPIYQQTFIRPRKLRRFGLPGDFEGTSMSSPHVAAVAALLIGTKRLGPNPSPRAIERHLEATAIDAGPPGFDERYGHGLVDAAAALATAPVP